MQNQEPVKIMPRVVVNRVAPEKVSPTIGAAPAQKPAYDKPIKPTVPKRKRSITGMMSFAILVFLPVLVSAWYLWNRAADRYETQFSFSVRSETSQPPQAAAMAAMMGGGGTAASDAGVVADFIRSREMVSRLIDAGVPLGEMFSRYQKQDPVFSAWKTDTVEDIADYWERAVHVERDQQTGIVRVNVVAFSPDDATLIAKTALAESEALVDEISEFAKRDVMRSSEEELAIARKEHEEAREDLTRFRVENNIVDPQASLAGRIQIIDTLRAQLDEAILARDAISQGTRAGDVRVEQANLKIKNLEDMIAKRSAEFGDEKGYAKTASEYENLAARAEFAEITLRNALMTRDAARKEADMRSSYLAAHVMPHLAQKSVHPDKPVLMIMILVISVLVWAAFMAVHSHVKERN